VTYGSRPVVVLTSVFGVVGGPEIARRSTNSLLANDPVSGHNIPGDNPPLVAEAVRLVIAAVRSGNPLPGCEQTTLPSYGARCVAVGP
jgi:uncharacterized protein YneF (UPF0154 family)